MAGSVSHKSAGGLRLGAFDTSQSMPHFVPLAPNRHWCEFHKTSVIVDIIFNIIDIDLHGLTEVYEIPVTDKMHRTV